MLAFALELPVEMGLQCRVVGRRADLFHRFAVGSARDLRDCLLEIALLWHVRTGLVPPAGPTVTTAQSLYQWLLFSIHIVGDPGRLSSWVWNRVVKSCGISFP